MSPEEAARRLREQHPLNAERVQRIAALLLSVSASGRRPMRRLNAEQHNGWGARSGQCGSGGGPVEGSMGHLPSPPSRLESIAPIEENEGLVMLLHAAMVAMDDQAADR